MHAVEVCLAYLQKAGVWAPLLPFLVAIKVSKSLHVDAVVILIVQRNTLISTTKGSLLAFAGFAELCFLIHPLGNAIQHRQGLNSNSIIKGIYISHEKNKALSSNVLLLLKSERSSSHMSCSMLFFPDMGFCWEVVTHRLWEHLPAEQCFHQCSPHSLNRHAHYVTGCLYAAIGGYSIFLGTTARKLACAFSCVSCVSAVTRISLDK